MRENISELLELSGYEVASAENGKVGVELVEEFHPDLIVCDVMMPELDGYGVLYVLSKNSKTASIPFIFLTAKTEKTDFRKGMSLGADDYLTKPFEELELLNAIENRLKRFEVIKRDYSDDAEGLYEFLKEAEGLEVIQSLTKDRKTYKYNAKEYIFREEDMANFLYFIERGKVKTYKLNDEGKEYIVEIHGAGDYLGYQPLLEVRRYTEYATALEETEIYKIPKDDFLKLIYNNQEVSSRFIKMMSRNLTQKEDQLLQLAYDSVRKRVALRLKDLFSNLDDKTIHLSRGDLANAVATSKETLVRTLTGMKEDNIIDSNGQSITLLDESGLDNIIKWS